MRSDSRRAGPREGSTTCTVSVRAAGACSVARISAAPGIVSRRRALATWASLLAVVVLAGCGGSGQVAPDSTSPLSTDAEEAPLADIGRALTADPTEPPQPTSAGAAAAEHSHDHAPATAAASLAPEESSAAYVCPMHADVTSAYPGKCPRCGMALVPVARHGVDNGEVEAPAPSTPGHHHAH